MGIPMVGNFEHRGLEIQWTCEEQRHASDDGSRWMFQAELMDITVRRYFPEPLSGPEAVAEARSIAPELFRFAVLELVRRHDDGDVTASARALPAHSSPGF